MNPEHVMFFVGGMFCGIGLTCLVQQAYDSHRQRKHENWQYRMQEKQLNHQLEMSRPTRVVTEGPCQVIPIEEVIGNGDQTRPAT